jgi:hypothetical protein
LSGSLKGNGASAPFLFDIREKERLAAKWFMVTDTRVVKCDDPVNYKWVDGRLEQVETSAN